MKDTSVEIKQYVEQTAKIINLSIAPESLPGVIDNFNRIAEIADLVNEFNLPENIESASTFKP